MSNAELPSSQELANVSKLFALLDDAGRDRLLRGATRRTAPAGEVVCHEGEEGDDFYVVLSGRVLVTADDFGTAKRIAQLGRGAFFGEMAVLVHQPRSATVIVEEDADLLVFGRKIVDEVLHDYPTARQALSKVGVKRTEELMEKLAAG